MVVEEQKIELEGLPTRYLTAGEGPPLLLLHGVGDNAFDWQWVMPALAHTYQVYSLDLPGSGGSAKPLPDYSPAFFARFTTAFLDALGVERAAVVGNSLGGLVGLRLALSGPERVACGTGAGFKRRPRAGGHLRPALAGSARLRQAGGRLGQEASWGSPEGLGPLGAPFCASLACASRMDQGAVPAGEATGLFGGPAGDPSRPGRT